MRKLRRRVVALVSVVTMMAVGCQASPSSTDTRSSSNADAPTAKPSALVEPKEWTTADRLQQRAAWAKTAAGNAAVLAAAEKAAAEKAAAEKAAAAAAARSWRPAPDASEADAATAGSDFDRAYALDKAADIIEDITSVDERMQDGIMVASALGLLSDSYGRLASAGTPPNLAAATYMSRLNTLQSFAQQAADEMEYAPLDGSARYAVLREQSGVLLSDLNAALGTDLRLP